MSALGPEAPRPLRKPGDTDAVTFSWADARAGVYGLARVASGLLADGTTSHSVLAVGVTGSRRGRDFDVEGTASEYDMPPGRLER